jgi:hypothetical protein
MFKVAAWQASQIMNVYNFTGYSFIIQLTSGLSNSKPLADSQKTVNSA